jgi:hypothetical protein
MLMERKIEMKENAKLILVAIIAIVVSSTISITATTMIQADKVSYKTSNGDTTDVNSALDRLFDLNTVNEKIGSTDISSIGDGTINGAISNLNGSISNINGSISNLTGSISSLNSQFNAYKVEMSSNLKQRYFGIQIYNQKLNYFINKFTFNKGVANNVPLSNFSMADETFDTSDIVIAAFPAYVNGGIKFISIEKNTADSVNITIYDTNFSGEYWVTGIIWASKK